MPFTVWATGTTVTAADFNTFLQQQVLTTWADLTALNAGIASPTEGMFAFTKNNDTLYYRSSSAWVATSLAADITEVATPAVATTQATTLVLVATLEIVTPAVTSTTEVEIEDQPPDDD